MWFDSTLLIPERFRCGVYFNTRIELAGTEMSQTVCLICLSDVMAACRSPKPFVGVRVPRGMPGIVGGSPSGKASDFDSDIRWFDPIIPCQICLRSSVVEQCLDKALVASSILAGGTNYMLLIKSTALFMSVK